MPLAGTDAGEGTESGRGAPVAAIGASVSPGAIALLNALLTWVLFLGLAFWPDGRTLALACCLAAVSMALCRAATNSLLGLLGVSALALLLGNHALLSFRIVSLLGSALNIPCSPASVSPSAFVPETLLAVLLGWLLFDKRTGLWLVLAALVTVMTIVGSLTLAGTKARLDPAKLTEVLLLARTVLLFASGFGLFVLVRREYVRKESRRPSSAKLAILFSLVGLCFALSLAIRMNGAVNSGVDRVIAIWWPPSDQEVEKGYLEASRATGLDNIGLFGELPRSLVRAGHCVRKVTVLSAESLSDVGVLCLLGPFRPLDATERQAIQGFVANGGRLLVAAEHTNLDRNRDIYNDLLSPYDISINFDTVTSLVDSTIKGTKVSRQPLGCLFGRHPSLTYNRGASLHLRGWRATPVLVADLWHSDAGDEANQDGGCLGDELWSEGDRVGNLVLVASWEGSKGSVTVFGDTSPFINRNLPYNESFIRDLFGYVASASGTGARSHWLVPAMAAVLSLASIGLCLALSRKGRLSPRGGQVIGIASWLPLLVLCAYPERPHVEAKASAACAFLSTAENNLFSRDSFSASSLTALGVAALREGWSIAVGHWKAAGPGDMLFIINPTRRIPLPRVMALLNSGGTAVVSGAGSNQSFREFSESLGVAVGRVPRGSLGGPRLKSYSAWELSGDAADWEPLAAGRMTVGLVGKVGNGRLVLIADEGFFYSKNLEDGDQRDEKNAEFLRSLLAR